MRALLQEEEALDALERSLLAELAVSNGWARGAAVLPEAQENSFSEVVHAFERRLIMEALDACSGVQRDAASMLGISPTTLNEKLKRLGIPHGRRVV